MAGVRKVVLITDAPLGEVRHPKGSDFTIVGKRPDQLSPGEVDERTGDAWLRFDWAREVNAEKPAKARNAD